MRIKEECLILKTDKELFEMFNSLQKEKPTPDVEQLKEQIKKEIKDRLDFYLI